MGNSISVVFFFKFYSILCSGGSSIEYIKCLVTPLNNRCYINNFIYLSIYIKIYKVTLHLVTRTIACYLFNRQSCKNEAVTRFEQA